jgi:hypothetical protein
MLDTPKAFCGVALALAACSNAGTTQTGNAGGSNAGAAGTSGAVNGGASSGGASSGGASSGGTSPGGGGSGQAGGGSGGSAGNSGSGGSAGSTPTQNCDPPCGLFSCCNGTCVNLANDIHNCGGCGIACEGPQPFCDAGQCGSPPCGPATDCGPDSTCCVDSCCGAGELCCAVQSNFIRTECFAPENGTCPKGCLECDCAAPQTPIATPAGDRAIANLVPGDLVYSVDEHGIVVVPVKQINRTSVQDHLMIRITLDTGVTLELSPNHPLASRGKVMDLVTGVELGERRVKSVSVVPYGHPFTYDILPDSPTGAYFAGGALMGSTLR